MKSCRNYKSVHVHQIVRTQPSGGTPSSVSPWFGYLPDPTMILRGPNKVKHLNIVGYVNLAALYQESLISNAAEDVIESLVKAKTGPVWPQLEDFSITMWKLANIRIMDELLNPASQAVCAYWDYTARINSMFRDKDHQSVLQYNHAYHIKQG